MRLKELDKVLYSVHGDFTSAIVYDKTTDIELEDGCLVDYAVANYGDRVVDRITAENNKVVIHLGKEN